MNPHVFRMVLLVSCAHALVHVFELSLPSVEQMIGDEFAVGKSTTGVMGTAWRLPFGLGAIVVGWFADRFGSKPMLVLYLLGCGVTAFIASMAGTLPILFVTMILMGSFASIYHPAGLALISRQTSPENRGQALGWHGIFGSVGIAAAPFLAAICLSGFGWTWRTYYVALAIPAWLVAVALILRLPNDRPRRTPQPIPDDQHSPTTKATREASAEHSHASSHDKSSEAAENVAQWRSFFLLVVVGGLSGFCYGAFLHFLPRYLNQSGLALPWISAGSGGNEFVAIVLACGIFGQAVAGRFAAPGRLENLETGILLANIPCFLAMAFAVGYWRLVATCLLAFVHFMTQPVYNSLIPQYVPLHRRSVSFGFSNMICFGIGAFGPAYAGLSTDPRLTYGRLAVVIAIAAAVSTRLPRNSSSI